MAPTRFSLPPCGGGLGWGVDARVASGKCYLPDMASPVARKLRKSPTAAERKLWAKLRDKQLDGFRFRRQVPMGGFVVDFFCPAAKLIVELDGGQHARQVSADDARTAWLRGRGHRVVRYWNNDVIENLEGVLEALRTELRKN